jgi:hypothetical protein
MTQRSCEDDFLFAVCVYGEGLGFTLVRGSNLPAASQCI